MEEGPWKGGDERPQLLDLIPKERAWMKKDSRGEGGMLGAAEEKQLELRLGPPEAEEDWPSVKKDKREDSSSLSLNLFPKAPKNSSTTTAINSCAGAKRLFLDTVEPKTEGFQLNLGKLPSNKTSGRAEQQQSLERKPCCSPAAHASSAPSGSAAVANHASQTRTYSTPVVGWPPIRSFRKNLASGSSKPSVGSQNGGLESGSNLESCKKGLFVKINMDGIAIGRKVDLKAYDSYDKLSGAVEELFRSLLAVQSDPAAAGTQDNAEEQKVFTGLLDGNGEYTLVYEDSEGDRMLVGDIPWDMFVATAKRLRVLKSCELSMLSLGGVGRKRTAC